MNSILTLLGWKRIALDVLKREGIVHMPGLSHEQIDEMIEHIKEGKDALTTPLLFEIALAMYDLASNYYGRKVYLQYVDKMDIDEMHTRSWSRYMVKALCIYIFASAHEHPTFIYQKRSHTENKPCYELEAIYGDRGHIFIAELTGIHLWKVEEKPYTMFRALWMPDIIGHSEKPKSRVILGDRYPKQEALQDAVKLVVA